MFTTTKSLLRKGFAALGVMAVAAAGFASTASAAPSDPINPDTKGSVTVHALIKDDGATTTITNNGTAQDTTGYKPVPGAVFKVTKTDLDRTKNEDVNTASRLTATELKNQHVAAGATVVQSDPTAADGTTTIGNLEPGIYVLEQVSAPAGFGQFAPQPAVVFVPMTNETGDGYIYDVHVYPKNQKFDLIKKELITGKNDVIVDGSKIQFNIATPIPTLLQDEKFTEFTVTDTPTSGLKVTGNDGKVLAVNVKADGTKVELTLDTDYTVADGADGANTKVVTLTEYGRAKADEAQGGVLNVEIELTVALYDENGKQQDVVNNATSTYKGDKGSSGDNKTPEDDTNTFKFATIEVLKHEDGDEAKVLEGATFQLFKCNDEDKQTGDAIEVTNPNDTTQKVTDFTTDAAGKAQIGPMSVGKEGTTVCLVETKAPAGYEKLAKAYVAELKADTENNAVVQVKIANVNSSNITSLLPLTGGKGIALFLAVGAALLGGAYYASRRNKA